MQKLHPMNVINLGKIFKLYALAVLGETSLPLFDFYVKQVAKDGTPYISVSSFILLQIRSNQTVPFLLQMLRYRQYPHLLMVPVVLVALVR